jgi:CheY-like chemotaxis protein
LPDLIVSDLNMPGMNGLDFLKWHSVSAVARDIPVVVFSSSSLCEDMTQATRLGASGYLVKPVGYGDWKAQIGMILEHFSKASTERLR